MNERDLAVLEQYDLTVSEAWRGRGSYICMTDAGKKLLQTYRASEERARVQAALLQKLRDSHTADVDMPVPNREGCLVSRDRYGTGYLLKDYVEGRECDVGCRDEILEAAANLARIHLFMRLPAGDAPAQKASDRSTSDKDTSIRESPEENAVHTNVQTAGQTQGFARTVRRHNREMKKIRTFIRSKQNKSQFELCVLQYFSMFYEKGIRVQEALADAAFADMEEAAVREGCWRHGAYTQHNVLFTRNGVATVNFEHCAPGLQLEDLALFLRKMMEKYDWDEALGQRLLLQYGKGQPLDANAVRYLGLRLSYPEKFWKLLNRYYSLGKAWISDRSCARLVRLAMQEPKREAFVQTLL